jgi:predicted ATPase/class 3 adenylate cyclase
MESPSIYIPMDRRQALAHGRSLPERVQGTALFADISGFTPLTEVLARELGPQRGSEEITRHLNEVYDAVIAEVHNFGGSVIGFSGDAITCWFDQDNGLRATASGLAMQRAMDRFARVTVPSGKSMPLVIKTSIACGPARRFLVGDPEFWLVEVLAGQTLDRLAQVDHHTEGGEVVLDMVTAQALGDQIEVATWRRDQHEGREYAIIKGLDQPLPSAAWPQLAKDAIHDAIARPWLLPPVYERLRRGLGEFLAELRPAVSLFLSFTGIDYDRDPSAGRKIDAFIREVQTIIAQYEGSLIQLTIGDKGSYLYAAFGAPVAHEDDALRAASTALALRELALRTDYIVEARLGIDQGRMRTGAYGSRTMRTYGVLGNAANLAARLMQAAAPFQILASDAVVQTIGDALAWETLGPIRVKGRSEPIAIHCLAAGRPRRALRSLFEAEQEMPLVGRQKELALLVEKMALAAAGHGQIVGFTGQAGMGKSRLVAEAVRLADAQGWLRYGCECSSYGTNTSYHAWFSIWWHFFELDPAWPLPVQTESLTRQLNQIDPALTPRLPLLGAALNLPIPDNELTASFDAKLRKASLESLLVDCLRARSQQAPILLISENCQWLDPLSYDLLDVVARAIVNMPVLLVLAYRPPELAYLQEPRVSGLAHYDDRELAPFTPQEAESLIAHKLNQAYGGLVTIPPELIERITQRSGGNPFYIDELLTYLQTQGIDPQDRQALARLDLPTSLQSLILSRLDQLADSPRITLKVASVIGRSFEAATLWGFYPSLGDEQQVKQNLARLEQADLTFEEAPEPDLIYAFRQVLTQEVSYESLPYATRATLHEQLGEFIERTFANQLDQHLDRLAYHYGASQNDAKKREYWLRAGRRAQQTYANTAAIDYYRRVLPLLTDQEKPVVLLDLGRVLELVGRWAEAKTNYEQALQLAEKLDDVENQAWCESAIGEMLRKQGLFAEATVWLAQARLRFEQVNDNAGVAQVLHTQGTLSNQQGDLQSARRLYEESLAIRQSLGDNAKIASLYSNLGIVARHSGNNVQARELYQLSLEIRQALGDRWALGVSLNNLGNLALAQYDYGEARTSFERALGIWREVGDRWAIANTLTGLGDVAVDEGDYDVARRYFSESLKINQELNDRLALAYLFEALGCLAALQEAPRRALRLAAAAAKLREAIGAPLAPAEATRLQEKLAVARQQLNLREQDVEEAVGRALSFEQAIELAMHWTEN